MARSRALPALIVACIFLSVHQASSGPAKLTHLFPIAGQRGSVTAVTAFGTFEPWPPKVWVDSSGITFKPGEKSPNFQVEIAPDAVPGPRLVRVYNEDGVSEPRIFLVTEKADLLEAEPNDDFKAPQKVAALSAVVSGRLEKSEDVDSYAMELKRGQTLVASMDAYVLASTVDGMLRIIDPSGAQYAFNHDAQTMDPFVAWEVPHDGTYIVQVMGFAYPANAEIRFTGGEGCVYRLHLSTGPLLRHTIPMSVTRGVKTTVELVGWNLPAASAEVDAAQCLPGEDKIAIADGAGGSYDVPVSAFPEAVEPAENGAEPMALPVPGAVTGRISRADDVDRFTFAAIKERQYRVRVSGSSVGSLIDPWLKIEDKDGKEVATADDQNSSPNPELAWTAPADGIFRIAIGDVTHRGGSEFAYRVQIEEASPALEAVAAEHSLKLEPGKSGEFKVTVKPLHGFKSKLRLIAKTLPDGISALPLDVPGKGGELTLKFEAKADAAPSAGPFQLMLQEFEGGKEHPVKYSLVNTSENNGVPQGYSSLLVESTDQLWLTVTKPAAP